MKVIFRIFEGEPIALFPELPGDCNAHVTCLSYQHIGQHSAACVNLTGRYTKPATPEQYAPLLAELVSIGYENLILAKRATRKDYIVRLNATEAVYNKSLELITPLDPARPSEWDANDTQTN